VTYLVLESAEIVLAERVQLQRGDPEATDVQDGRPASSG
jgi:hypothetical protein